MHHGCVRSRQRRPGRGSGGVVADIAKLSVGREEYYTRELATDHEQYLFGHGESPGRWYGAAASSLGLEGEASPAGFQAIFEGRDPTTGELLGRPHGRNAVPAFDVVLRPTKSVSILYGPGRPGHRPGGTIRASCWAGRGDRLPGREPGGTPWPRRIRACVRTGAAGGRLRPPDIQRRRSAVAHPSGHRQPGPGAGRPLDSLGRPGPVPHRLAADAIYRATYQRELARTLGVEWTPADAYGNRELQGMPEDLVRASPSAPARSTPSWTGWSRTVGSGRRGWSSGRFSPPVSPSSTSHRTPCTTAGVRRRPSADTTRTPWSGR
jgi:hypothetical protein